MREAPGTANAIGRKLSDLQRANLRRSAEMLGLDLSKYEAGAKQGLAALQELLPGLVAEREARAPDIDATLKSLVPRSRRIGRDTGWLAYKPDPFGPPEVVTEGPYLDLPGIPLPTVPVCRVTNTTILDTSANQGLSLQVVTGSEDAAAMTESFDATSGVNEGRFTFGVSGSQILEMNDLILSAGFRFNFFPPQDGEYRVRPVAVLNGVWQLLASADPIFNAAASIHVVFRTRVSQFADGNGGAYFYHDVPLADASAAGTDDDGSFFYQTAVADDPGAAHGHLAQDLRAHVVIGCAVRVKTVGLSAAFLDVHRPKLFLRVPEVHVDQLDCSGSVALGRQPRDEVERPPPDLPPPGGPPLPGPRR